MLDIDIEKGQKLELEFLLSITTIVYKLICFMRDYISNYIYMRYRFAINRSIRLDQLIQIYTNRN